VDKIQNWSLGGDVARLAPKARCGAVAAESVFFLPRIILPASSYLDFAEISGFCERLSSLRSAARGPLLLLHEESTARSRAAPEEDIGIDSPVAGIVRRIFFSTSLHKRSKAGQRRGALHNAEGRMAMLQVPIVA